MQLARATVPPSGPMKAGGCQPVGGLVVITGTEHATCAAQAQTDLEKRDMTIPTLETDRLLLRSFEQRDFDAYAQMCSDPRFMRFLMAGAPLSREDAWRNLAFIQGHWSLLGYGIWAVALKENDLPIGTAGLLNPDGWPGLEMSWALAPGHWGRGYATEAVTAAINWAFQELRVPRLISLIHPDNTPSAALALRVGERRCDDIEFKGKTFQLYEITRP
jgi:RimJ/RimL family protein N-acetyltransferase